MNAPIRELPAADPRVESGVVQFGDDWPGTFIRGDVAFGYAHHLERVLNTGLAIDAISLAVLRGLLSDLQSSNLLNRTQP